VDLAFWSPHEIGPETSIRHEARLGFPQNEDGLRILVFRCDADKVLACRGSILVRGGSDLDLLEHITIVMRRSRAVCRQFRNCWRRIDSRPDGECGRVLVYEVVAGAWPRVCAFEP